MPTFDDFRHCLTIFFSETVLCFSTVEGYNKSKKAVQQCQFLMLFGTVELFSFSGGNVVLRRFWWLVLQCGNKGCSLVPILDGYWHCWKWFSFAAAVLYFGTVESYYISAEKNAIQQCQLLRIFRHCWTFSYFPATMLYFGAVDG